MIWFGIALLIAVIYGIGVAWQEDAVDGFFCFLFACFFGACGAALVNIGFSFVGDDKVVDGPVHAIKGEVFVTIDNGKDAGGLLKLNLDDAKGIRYTDYGVEAKFVDSPERTFYYRDYQVHNKWLSIMNWQGDDLIINIPASEKVELRK